MTTILPAQDNLDIELDGDEIILTQVTLGDLHDIRFHRIHLPTIIKALEELRDAPVEKKDADA